MRHALLALALALAAGCAPAPPPAPTLPTIRITGTDVVVHNLMEPLAENYERTVGDLHFEVGGGGTSRGFRALLEGRADMVVSTRRFLPAEEEQASANGWSFEDEGARHIAAVDVVALAVHPSNPIRSISYDQVIGIFCTRSVDSWAYLGLEGRPIHPLARDPLSGTQTLFEDFFCGPSGIHPSVETHSSDEIASALEKDPDAIAFVSMSNASGKLLGLRPFPQGMPIWPSQQNIIRGRYPLFRDIFLYTAGPAKEKERLFIDWIASPAGQDVVDEARFVPLYLRPDRLDEPRPLRETVHFDEGESTPNQRSLARLQLLVDDLRDRSVDKRHVVLEGFTDPTEAEPLALSQQRAEAVQHLLQAELPGLFFEIIPRGGDRPLAPNETPYGRHCNRRVQVYLAEEEAPAPNEPPPEAP
ncbi:MAG: substrate-binding domain-containing protein [Deltaproteobacteria bacterium]|nr:substrate-binding domain-containing protein [Deltaproteobacteria bacterium]